MSTIPVLQQLNRDDCLALLVDVQLGRVGVSVDALPAVFPVFITVVDERIVFRAVPGTKLLAALDEAIVAIETDRLDEATSTGWSVLVRGIAREISDPDVAHAARLRLGTTWLENGRERLVEVSTDLITGRRLV